MSDQPQPKYQDQVKFLKAVIEKFQATEKLSYDWVDGTCLYGTKINGIGCSVGCMLDPADANLLDEKYCNENIYTVSNGYPEIYNKYFPHDWVVPPPSYGYAWGSPIRAGFLDRLQYIHDNVETVAEFLEQAQVWLEELEAKNVQPSDSPAAD